MAAKSKLELLLELNDKMFNNKLSQAQKKLNQGIDGMKGKLGQLRDYFQRSFAQITEQIPFLDRALNLIKNPWVGVIAGGAAFFAMTKKAISAASEFDHAFLPIRQLNLDKSKQELDNYRKQVRDAAFDVGINLTKATDAIHDLQSATGVYGDDAIEIFKKIGQYSLATGADVGESMNATTKAMKAFGLGTDDIDKLLESNAKTVQVAITTFDELARVQTQYAGATASAGQSVDVGNKVFAMFTSIAKSGDIAANMTKTFFQGLGMQAANIKDTLNIDVFDVHGNMREADRVLMEISDKFKNMNDQQITEAINLIGGPEGLRAALAKVNTGAEDMISVFESFDSSQFSMAEAVKNAEGDFNTMKQVFFDRIEILMTKFGEKILPMVAEFFDKLTPVLNWLYQNIDWLVPTVGSFVGVLGLATVAMWAFNAAANANPIGLIVMGVAGLIALIVLVIKKWDEWGAAITLFMGPVGIIIRMFKSLYDHWDSIKKAFQDGGILEGLKRIGIVLLDALLKPVQQLLEMLSRIPGLGGIATRGASKIEAMRERLDLITPGEREAKARQKKKEKERSLYDVDPDDTVVTPPVKTPYEVVSETAGSANQVRTVNITIESFIKGMQLSQTATEGLSMDQFEAKLKEMFQRVIINGETI